MSTTPTLIARPLALLGVPVDCTGMPGQCADAPAVLRALGVAEIAGMAVDRGDLRERIDDPARDPASGVIGARGVVGVNRAAKAEVAAALVEGQTPVMLGGCCSYVMGAIAAARDARGPIGLIYVDGHMDLYDGRTSPTGECADMALAFVLGHGPGLLREVIGAGALVDLERVALLGYRDRLSARQHGALLPEALGEDFFHRDIDQVRARGFGQTALDALQRLHGRSAGFWLHVDWDVLHERSFASADYPMAGGCRWHELFDLLEPLARSPALIGLSTACYNPHRDPDGNDGARIVLALRRLLGETGA